MQPLARNVDFYGFLPKNSQDKVVQSSLHFANAVFIMDGKVQKYGRVMRRAVKKSLVGRSFGAKTTVRLPTSLLILKVLLSFSQKGSPVKSPTRQYRR